MRVFYFSEEIPRTQRRFTLYFLRARDSAVME